MPASEGRLATAHLDSGTARYAQTIRVGHHTLVADEPASVGGGDTGASPYGILLAALAACTSITLRMYGDRKGWELGAVHVDLVMERTSDGEHIQRTIRVGAIVMPVQRARLAVIAEKSPVSLTLKLGTPIVSSFE